MQVTANMLTTFTSSSDWGYGKPIFIGGLLGMGMPVCGLFIDPSVGAGAGAGNLPVNQQGTLGTTEPLLSCESEAGSKRREAAKSTSAAMIAAPLASRHAEAGAGSFFYLQNSLRQRHGASAALQVPFAATAARPATM